MSLVEITESLMMSDDPNVKAELLKYRDAGIQLAIDDFGTGYSALLYLKKFDIDYLKIDRSFTKNADSDATDLALCEAIVAMAHKLGIKVIAEGIETAEQHAVLKGIGCDYGQGTSSRRPCQQGCLKRCSWGSESTAVAMADDTPLWCFADQLSPNIYGGEHAQRPILLVEADSALRRRRFHRQKLHLVLSALRHADSELGERATLIRSANYTEALRRYGRPVLVCEPTSHAADRFVRRLRAEGLVAEILPTSTFALPRRDFRQWAGDRRRFRLEDFYREQRRRFGILMDGNGEPVGGRWNYDVDNREPPPRGRTALGIEAPYSPGRTISMRRCAATSTPLATTPSAWTGLDCSPSPPPKPEPPSIGSLPTACRLSAATKTP